MQARLSMAAAFTLILSGVAAAQTKPGLDTTTFIVMGEGLAAGMGNFGLSAPLQIFSFPAQAAAQMNAALEQPLMQPPGIGDVVGSPGQEVRLQNYPQGAVRTFYTLTSSPIASPPIFVQNLSVPGLTLQDSVSLRPVSPIAQRNMKQTVVNMILGFPQLFLNVPLWNQFEYAKALFPSVTLIELGYSEALNASVNLDSTLLPDPNTFGSTYASVISGLRAEQSQVIATTIPNPLDTAYFSSPATAAAITSTTAGVITSGYGITAQDYVGRNALNTISTQLANGTLAPLPAGSILTAAAAANLTAGINALNAQIVSAAKANGAVVYDLNAFLHNIKLAGAAVGSSTLTASYLGGFYTLDAVYPGPTGNALIANDFLSFLNSAYHRSFPLVGVSSVFANDPVVAYQIPQGALFTASSLGIFAPGGPQ